jgi:hypothetical protein
MTLFEMRRIGGPRAVVTASGAPEWQGNRRAMNVKVVTIVRGRARVKSAIRALRAHPVGPSVDVPFATTGRQARA